MVVSTCLRRPIGSMATTATVCLPSRSGTSARNDPPGSTGTGRPWMNTRLPASTLPLTGTVSLLVARSWGQRTASSTRRSAGEASSGPPLATRLTVPGFTSTRLPWAVRFTDPVTAATATTPRPSAVTKKWPPWLYARASLPSTSTSTLPLPGSTSDSTEPRTCARSQRKFASFRRRAEASCTRILTPSTPTSASPSCVRSASLGARRSPTCASDQLPSGPRCSSTLPLREMTTAVARTCGSPGGSGPVAFTGTAGPAGARPQAASTAAQISARPAHEGPRFIWREYEPDRTLRKFHSTARPVDMGDFIPLAPTPRAHPLPCIRAHARQASPDAPGGETRVAALLRECRAARPGDRGDAAVGEPRAALTSGAHPRPGRLRARRPGAARAARQARRPDARHPLAAPLRTGPGSAPAGAAPHLPADQGRRRRRPVRREGRPRGHAGALQPGGARGAGRPRGDRSRGAEGVRGGGAAARGAQVERADARSALRAARTRRDAGSAAGAGAAGAGRARRAVGAGRRAVAALASRKVREAPPLGGQRLPGGRGLPRGDPSRPQRGTLAGGPLAAPFALGDGPGGRARRERRRARLRVAGGGPGGRGCGAGSHPPARARRRILDRYRADRGAGARGDHRAPGDAARGAAARRGRRRRQRPAGDRGRRPRTRRAGAAGAGVQPDGARTARAGAARGDARHLQHAGAQGGARAPPRRPLAAGDLPARGGADEARRALPGRRPARLSGGPARRRAGAGAARRPGRARAEGGAAGAGMGRGGAGGPARLPRRGGRAGHAGEQQDRRLRRREGPAGDELHPAGRDRGRERAPVRRGAAPRHPGRPDGNAQPPPLHGARAAAVRERAPLRAASRRHHDRRGPLQAGERHPGPRGGRRGAPRRGRARAEYATRRGHPRTHRRRGVRGP